MGNQPAQQRACPYRVDCGCPAEMENNNFVVKVQRNGFALGSAVEQVETTPPLLFVVSPNGQQMCAGVFVLVSGISPNGLPLWRKAATDSGSCRWLYSSVNGNWNIGGHKAESKQFRCHAAHIFSDTRHHGAMPHHAPGTWWRLTGNGFHKDPAITVSTIKAANSVDQYLNDWPVGEKSTSGRKPKVASSRGSCDERSSSASSATAKPSQPGGRSGFDSARGFDEPEGDQTPSARLGPWDPTATPGASSTGAASSGFGARSRQALARMRPLPRAQKEFKTPPECIHDPAADRDVLVRLRLVAQKLQELERRGKLGSSQVDDEDFQSQELCRRLEGLQEKRLAASSSETHRAVEVGFFPSVKRRDTKVTFAFPFRPLGIEFENICEMMVVKGFSAGSGAPALGVREGMVVSTVAGVDVSQWSFQEGLEQLWREVK